MSTSENCNVLESKQLRTLNVTRPICLVRHGVSYSFWIRITIEDI